MKITPELLRRIAPVPRTKQAAQRQITDAIAPHLDRLLPEAGIVGPFRVAHFLAQAAHETDSFSTLEEYASGRAYEGRADLGNVQAGDGPRFKGRGIFQTTGRANYRTTGERLGVDLITEPHRLLEPELAVRSAIDYWQSRSLSRIADSDNIELLTRRINGGLNGIAHRRECLARASAELFGGPLIALRLGAQGRSVKVLQTKLEAVHYFPGAIDGAFGPRTDDAVRAFQRDNHLAIDGVVGPDTWAMLGQKQAAGVTRPVGFLRANATMTDLASDGSRIASSAVRGMSATIGAVLGALPLVLVEASGMYRQQLKPLQDLLEPFGGPDRIALGLLVVVCLFSAWQHTRAGLARVDDQRSGKTL